MYGSLHGDGIGGADDVVAFVAVHELRLVVQQLRFAVAAIRADDHAVADGRLVRGGAVHGDDARAGFGADRVGRETFAVGQVVDLDLLVLADAGCIEQLAVDRARTLVIELGMRDAGAVKLGFQHQGLHRVSSAGPALAAVGAAGPAEGRELSQICRRGPM